MTQHINPLLVSPIIAQPRGSQPRVYLRAPRALGFALLAFTLAGCVEMLHSDSENASRRAHRARAESLRAMKLGSAQAAPGQVVTGEALPKMLAGQSHISEYRKAVGDAKPYITVYDYFGSDGSFISRDTHGRRTPAYQTVGRWRVSAGLLCIATPSQPGESCYTIRRAADGALQYWIAKPGDPFDGLLTKSVRIVRPGLQEPEYVSPESVTITPSDDLRAPR